MITYSTRIKTIEEKSKNYRTIKEFYQDNPYLYRWSLKHKVDLQKYFTRVKKNSKFSERANKGIDCYKVGSSQLYKHYAFVIEALRELDLTYYYVKKVLDGDLESIDGYVFVRCQ